jgi:FAD/FMN-containing dehydrogenase
MFRIPPVDAFPAKFHGQPALDFVLCHLDARALGAVQPLRELGDTILEMVGPLAYTAVQQGFDANLPKGQRYYSRAHLLDGLWDAAIGTITEHVTAMKGAFTAAYLEPYGGAIGPVGPSQTAFCGRKAAYSFHILAGWMDATDDNAMMTWAGAFQEAMAAHATGGVYVNLLGEDEDGRVPAAYGENYRRLVELKTRWDPDNRFEMNYNVKPRSEPGVELSAYRAAPRPVCPGEGATCGAVPCRNAPRNHRTSGQHADEGARLRQILLN